MESKFMYRADIQITHQRYFGTSEFFFTTADLKISVYEIIKETSKGFWIKDYLPEGDNTIFSPCYTSLYKPKWVSKTSRKRFAYPTEKEALIGLKHRTDKRMFFAKKVYQAAEEAKLLIEKTLNSYGN